MKNKYIIIIFIFIISFIYFIPNLYGEDPSIIINNNNNLENKLLYQIIDILKKDNITYKNKNIDNNNLIIRFSSINDQFNCFEYIKHLNYNINISQNIIPKNKPTMFNIIGAQPMTLGLDLRGGIHLIIKVHINDCIKNLIKTTADNIKTILKNNNIQYQNIQIKAHKIIQIKFKSNNINTYLNILRNNFPDLEVNKNNKQNIIILILKKDAKKAFKEHILSQTIAIINKRINELNILDSIVQQQSKNKIIIEIPGIQDISRAKNLLGKIATLKFMIVDTKHTIKQALKGKIPSNSKIYYDKNNIPVLIKKKHILSGDEIIYASSGFENQFNKPCINIKINSTKIHAFEQITAENIGKPMAIIYKETIIINDNDKHKKQTKETIINIATIMSSLGSQFQITGLNIQESKDLALLLRSGSLPAAVSIIEEKLIGPSLGDDNIKHGIMALYVSFIIILIFMLIYYKKLGIVANIALISNIILLIAIMSIIGITLTLPGLAGITLTIGMSIDANILIFERIKEECKNNYNIDNIIERGFKNSLTSIIDSNFTTLLIGIILLTLGDGPVKGFAITLSLGIITSLYASTFVTKILIKNIIKKL